MTPDEVELLARWVVGADVPEDALRAVRAAMTEDDSLTLAEAVRSAARAYRREHGKWPDYRLLPGGDDDQ